MAQKVMGANYRRKFRHHFVRSSKNEEMQQQHASSFLLTTQQAKIKSYRNNSVLPNEPNSDIISGNLLC